MGPTAIRRPLTITTWLVMSILCLALSPLMLALAALASAVIRRPQPLLVARLVIAYFARELAVLAGCGALWLISGCGWRIHSPASQRLHYRLLRWLAHGIAQRGLTLLGIDVAPEPSPQATQSLECDRPLLFFSRHAGPGDTVVLVDLLMTRYRRLPSVVFKDTLTIDPCIDLIGHRLPHAGLDTSDAEESEARIEQVAAELDRRGVLVLFPEGGNFSPERRRRSLEKLWRKGRSREAAAGEQMTHVLPPHPAGALAAIRGNPDCDVIFAAHTGLGVAAFPRELWRHPPIGKTLKTRMWLAPAAERPREPEAQARWLYDWWKRLDDWVESQGEATSMETAPTEAS